MSPRQPAPGGNGAGPAGVGLVAFFIAAAALDDTPGAKLGAGLAAFMVGIVIGYAVFSAWAAITRHDD